MQSGQWRMMVLPLLVALAFAANASAQEDWNAGLEAFNNKNYGAAAEQFQAVIERAPNYPGAFYMLGLTQRAQGKASQAVGNLRKAVELDPDTPLYRIELGNTLVQAGQYSDAFSLLQRMDVTKLPANYRTVYARAFAKAASEVGRADAAISIIGSEARSANDAGLWQALGALQAALDNHAEAFGAYRRAFELSGDPNHGSSAVRAGIATARRAASASQKNRLYTDVAGLSEQVSAKDPSFDNLLTTGEAWLGAKQYEKALSWFERAQAKQQQNALVTYYRAQCLTSLNRLDSALEALQQALRIGASGKLRQQIYTQMGYVYDKKKSYGDAARAYTEAGNPRMAQEMREKQELAAQNLQHSQECADFRRKIEALRRQIEELSKLGNSQEVQTLREQLPVLERQYAETCG